MPAPHLFWLIIWGLYLFGIYSPRIQAFRKIKVSSEHTRFFDAFLDFAAFVAWQVLPLLYIFTDWFKFADYELPDWAFWPGGLSMFAGFWGLLVSYNTLGHNWSPKIDIREGQRLVTTGIYGRIRHPIYAAIWLWAFANLLLLHNWIAGPSLLVVFPVLYFTRVPREETMLKERFGKAYMDYAARTGRLLPRRKNQQ